MMLIEKMQQLRQAEIHIDGAQGEGGGQVLRTALTLAVITGTPFTIQRIRAGRHKPGLLRQHLTAVQAAAAISAAVVDGATLGSATLRFQPGALRGGDYRFAIGTAGSCTLVLQTVLPALWFATTPSTVSVTGGTHNKAAPPADFLLRAWQPLMQQAGVRQTLSLRRHGFYPAGGGEVVASVEPGAVLRPLQLLERGAFLGYRAEAWVAAIPGQVAQRELERVRSHFADIDCAQRQLPAEQGPGNVVLLETRHDAVVELFCGFGEKRLSAESVADHAALEAKRYLASGAAVSEHLADQLLLPLALAGGGAFTTSALSSHWHTNKAVIAQFLPVQITAQQQAETIWRVSVA